MKSFFTVLELFLSLFTIGITLRLGARFADSGINNIKEIPSDIKEIISDIKSRRHPKN